MTIKLFFTFILFILIPLAHADQLDLFSGTSDFTLSGRLCENANLTFAANVAVEHFNLSANDSTRVSQLIAGTFGVPAYNPTPNGPNDPGVEGEFKEIMNKLSIKAKIVRGKSVLAYCEYKPKLYLANSLSHNEDGSTVSIVSIRLSPFKSSRTCNFTKASGKANLSKIKKGDKLVVEQSGRKLISAKFKACDEYCQQICDL